MKKIIVLSIALFFIFGISIFLANAVNTASDTASDTANAASTAKPSDYGLKEGDLISAIFSDDPDVYIINEDGYKRLFLNPEIFKFYSHLGGFVNVKLVTTEVRDAFITSGLFRNCEDNDQKVYGVDIDGEDTGRLHWVNVSGENATFEDSEFFKKVFCINNKEFKWYVKGSEFKSVKEVPKYERMEVKETVTTEKKIEANIPLKEEGKAVICHYPLGATNKFQEITIAASALKVHLEHGDIVGACPSAPQIGCTTDAKLCSDGSYVSRTGSNCEFSACPIVKSTCLPRPACLDATPRCLLAEPIEGWCQTTITVLYPNGGEVFQKGTTQMIEWKSTNVSKIYIKLGKGNDTYHGSEGMITDVIPNVGGYYKWTIPTTLPDGNDYYIRIVDGNQTGIYDDNDTLFSIAASATQTPTPSVTPIPSVSTAPASTPTPTSIPTPSPSPSVSPTPSVTPTPSPSATPTPTPTADTTFRIMYWLGKVNQHVDSNGNWLTDPDGVSGADLDKLTYCKKFYPDTISTEDYMLETTNTWRNRGNVGGPFTSTKMSTKCLQSSVFVTPVPSVSVTPTPTPISCAPITVSISPDTPSSQNVSSGQNGVPIVVFNIVANCSLNLNSFAVSLLPMPSGYQNISYLRLYNNATGAQLGSTVTASVAGLNFTGLSQPILANQTLSLKVMGDISSSAIVGSTVYGVFGGSSATDTAGAFVGNNASGNLISGNTMTIVASVANANQSNIFAAFSRNLTVGSIGDDVKQLQALLVKEVNYSTNLITGYFGQITRDAVKKLQTKYSVNPVSGFFGEITRKTLNAAILNW